MKPESRISGRIQSEPARRRRGGFTLTELLVVIGIIAVLISLLLPVIFRTQRQAEIARIRLEINVISTALEEYKKVFNDYPRKLDPNAAGPREHLLVKYLIGPNGDGIRMAGTVGPTGQGGKKWGPYLPPDKFTVMPGGLTGDLLMDHVGKEIQYYPRYNSYDMKATAGGNGIGDGYLLGRVSASPAFQTAPPIRAMFNRYDGLASDNISPDSNDHLAQTLYMLGDGVDTTNGDNRITGTETLTFNGPFMIVECGPDAKWGRYGGAIIKHSDVDDVYNFQR
jgi:prepilin-type N-terminal cleavage/methylation domain-containing protein